MNGMTIGRTSLFGPRTAISSSLALSLLIALALMLTGCDKDVTNDPKYDDFSSVVGTWKTKTPLTVFQIEKHLYLSTTDDLQRTRVGSVATGTTLRIEHLMLQRTEAGDFPFVTGTVTSGKFTGQSMHLDLDLFAPNRFSYSGPTSQPIPGYTYKWKVSPDRLEK